MPRARSRPPQECSLCGKTGHNKRRCGAPAFVFSSEVQPIRETRQDKKTTPVAVKTYDEHHTSSHLVDLKKDATRPLSGVEVFREKMAEHHPREVIDFGALVRQSSVVRSTVPALQIASRSRQMQTSPSSRWKEARENTIKKISALARSRRGIAAAIAMILLISLPGPVVTYYHELQGDRSEVVDTSRAGFLSLYDSTRFVLAADVPAARQHVQDAVVSFGTVVNLLHAEHPILLSLATAIPWWGEKIDDQWRLVQAGHAVSVGNAYLLKGLDAVQTMKDEPLTARMAIAEDHISRALPQYQMALQEIASIKAAGMEEKHAEFFHEFQSLFAGFVNDMKDVSDLLSTLRLIFGDEHPKRYLVLFQNEHEIRPTGGFISSFAVIDVQRGRLMGVESPGGGSYDLQGQLPLYRLPPAPLRLVNGRWEFQDINWFADFPTTARQAATWYESSRGRTVDGVLAINGSVLERILSVVGPIQDETTGRVLTPDTALDILESLEETTDFSSSTTPSTPKAIIGRSLETVLDRLTALNHEDLVQLLVEMHAALESKEIQVSIFDSEIEKQLEEFGWTGAVTPITIGQDYLSVTQANLQGQKSDAAIEQEIWHTAEMQEDGSVIDTVKILRRHTGIAGEPEVGVPNITYTRLAVPLGATLLDAGGFSFPPESAFHASETWYETDPVLLEVEKEIGVDRESGTRITEEFGKTVFGNWMIVSPGETGESTFRYRLPFALFDAAQLSLDRSLSWQERLMGREPARARYQMVTQKQSGVDGDITISVVPAPAWRPVWNMPSDATVSDGSRVEWNIPFKTDDVFGIVFERDDMVE